LLWKAARSGSYATRWMDRASSGLKPPMDISHPKHFDASEWRSSMSAGPPTDESVKTIIGFAHGLSVRR
jgi:hypothetical protein